MEGALLEVSIGGEVPETSLFSVFNMPMRRSPVWDCIPGSSHSSHQSTTRLDLPDTDG